MLSNDASFSNPLRVSSLASKLGVMDVGGDAKVMMISLATCLI